MQTLTFKLQIGMVSDPPQRSASSASLSSPGRGRQRSARKSRCRPCWTPGRKNEAFPPRGGRLPQADEGRGGSATPAGEHMTRQLACFNSKENSFLVFCHTDFRDDYVFICSIFTLLNLCSYYFWADVIVLHHKNNTYSPSGRRTLCFLWGFLGGRTVSPV